MWYRFCQRQWKTYGIETDSLYAKASLYTIYSHFFLFQSSSILVVCLSGNKFLRFFSSFVNTSFKCSYMHKDCFLFLNTSRHLQFQVSFHSSNQYHVNDSGSLDMTRCLQIYLFPLVLSQFAFLIVACYALTYIYQN